MSIKNLILFLIICILVVHIVMTFNVYINSDEPFTMSMIGHNFFHIFNIDLLDVHPPLYYLVLRLFLVIFTFWTHSIYIKIIFAKLFSFMFFIIAFWVLIKILKLIHINNINWRILLIGYLLIPNIITYSFQIRMYEMTFAFITIEFYELIRFDKLNDMKPLIVADLFALLASYTHYFGALSSGALLLSFLLVYLLKGYRLHALKIFFAGLIFTILFCPCILFAYRQFLYVISNKYSNIMGSGIYNAFPVQMFMTLTGFDGSQNILNILLDFILFIGSILLIIYSFKHLSSMFNDVFLKLIMALIISIILPCILLVVSHSIFQARYLYPLSSIFIFFLIVVFINIFAYHKYFVKEMFLLLTIAILCILNVSSINIIHHNNVRASQAIHVANVWDKSFKNKVYLSYDKEDGSNQTDLLIKESVYSKYMSHHPKLYVNHMLISQVLGRNNRKLLHENFNNIYLNGPSN